MLVLCVVLCSVVDDQPKLSTKEAACVDILLVMMVDKNTILADFDKLYANDTSVCLNLRLVTNRVLEKAWCKCLPKKRTV